MPKQQQKSSGGAKKYGRNVTKCEHYKAMKTREKNKLKRVLQSNGKEAAQAYAKEHLLDNYLRGLL